MITIYSYDIANGILTTPDVEQLPELLEAENVDLWIDFESPTAKESEILRSVFHFHELAFEDCIETDIEEAKLDDYEDYLFIVLHSVFFNRAQFTFNIIELHGKFSRVFHCFPQIFCFNFVKIYTFDPFFSYCCSGRN